MTIATRSPIPSHVPPELVVDIDVYNQPDAAVDPQKAWRCFKGKGPLVFSPYNGGHWITTVGDDVFRFYRDAQHYSSRLVAIPDPDADKMLPIQADAPDHSQYRAHIQSLFTPKAIDRLEPKIRALTVDLIEGFRAKGECEFVSEFSMPLPINIFLQMMGLPLEDRPYLRNLIEIYVCDPDIQHKADAHAEVHKYMDKWIDKRLAEPTDDGVTLVTKGTIHGRPYTRDEMLGTLTLLLHAGLDTVVNMLAFIVLHLARTPSDREYIRKNNDKMPDIIQELLRRFSGPNLGRVVAQDHTYKGVLLKKGDRVILPVSLFNMDEEKMEDPDTVDLTRSNARHITFGAGAHTCAGALLARREIAIFLEEWLTRIPDFEIDPARPVNMRALPQNTVFELWLRWKPAAAH